MRVLVVGSGGREHALCWSIRRSPLCGDLYCAPGNGGIGDIAEIVPIPVDQIDALADWASSRQIDLTVVGPDDPLAAGIVDRFLDRGLRIFGPTRAAAQIEWSKVWAKRFLIENGVPTARAESFDDPVAAHAYVDRQPGGVVVKADGLALGKGVAVCPTHAEAHAAIDAIMVERQLGTAGERIVVEELLVGREVSAFALCDGQTYRMLPFACDHKAAYDGDRGPNTGGMGAYSPPNWLAPETARAIEAQAIAPTFEGLRKAGRPFVGFLYCGAMICADGVRAIEFNARMGDPEAQAVLPRLDCDLLELLHRAADGRLSEAPPNLPVKSDASCCVVIASANYPASSPIDLPIAGLDRLDPNVLAFHAGTRRVDDHVVTAGGRVIGVTAFGSDLAEARARAYANVERVRFDGARYRRDIGANAVPAATSR